MLGMTANGENHSYGKGMTLALAGGLLLTFDVPLLKLSQAETATLILARGIILFTAMWLYWMVRVKRQGKGTPFVNGYTGVVVSCLMAAANILFINAIALTSVANVVFILAMNPIFAAVLSWILLGERLATATALAILACTAGVTIIVWDGLSTGTYLGDFLAVGVALCMSAALLLIRRSGTDQSMSPAFGSLIAAAAVLPFADLSSLTWSGWGWLTLNGAFVMPVSGALMLVAPMFIPAPVVALFFLLETVLTPVWMWLIFDDRPTLQGLAGGIIIVSALLLHCVWLLRITPQRPRPFAVSKTPPARASRWSLSR